MEGRFGGEIWRGDLREIWRGDLEGRFEGDLEEKVRRCVHAVRPSNPSLRVRRSHAHRHGLTS